MSKNLTVHHLYKILDLLESLQQRKYSLLNLTRLFELLNISKEELESLTEIIFRFQTFFFNSKEKFWLTKLWLNNQIYLKIIPISEGPFENHNQKIIKLNHEHIQLLNDIIYYFNHIKIGKLCNSNTYNSALTQKVKKLRKIHPYFFENRGNGTIYPSRLAAQLGKTLNLYKKGNRKIQNIQIEEYQIRVV